MKYILHVTVYAFCHINFIRNLYFFYSFQCIGCGMLPFFTSKNTLLFMSLVVDGVKCEGFLCGDCNIYNRGIKQEGGKTYL